jgi:hypothetical protein
VDPRVGKWNSVSNGLNMSNSFWEEAVCIYFSYGSM